MSFDLTPKSCTLSAFVSANFCIPKVTHSHSKDSLEFCLKTTTLHRPFNKMNLGRLKPEMVFRGRIAHPLSELETKTPTKTFCLILQFKETRSTGLPRQ